MLHPLRGYSEIEVTFLGIATRLRGELRALEGVYSALTMEYSS